MTSTRKLNKSPKTDKTHSDDTYKNIYSKPCVIVRKGTSSW